MAAAIKEHGMILISAQPDQTYFHWQVELYLYQFAKHGIANHCYALFGYRDQPSEAAKAIAAKFKNVFFYKDTRNLTGPHHYIPSIRPHILKQFFAEHPTLGRNVFYHDSDIFLVNLPRFDLLLADDIGYVSDTISYIGYTYVKERADAYKKKYPNAPDILDKMCAVAGISKELVKENQANAGGAQYLLKGIDAAFWTEVEDVCQKLYTLMKDHEAKYPLNPNDIQAWTADMWAVLWLYLKRGPVRVHKELEFSWGTFGISDYYKLNIFHLAGVTENTCKDKFFKGLYVNRNVFKEYLKNPAIFDHVSPNNATYGYVQVLKEYASGLPPPIITDNSRFFMKCDDVWSAIYEKEGTLLGQPVWKAVDKPYMIFHNGSSWTITHTQYEKNLGKDSGGFVFSNGEEAHQGWSGTVELLEPIPDVVLTENQMRLRGKWAGVYTKGADVLGKPAWRGPWLIFHNGNSWVITDQKYEKELKEGSGGFASSSDLTGFA
jgi:hypothetical protein